MTSHAPAGERSTPPARPARRWLIIGDAEAQRVEALLAEEPTPAVVVRTPTFLAALGELGREPADVVLGPASAAEGMAGQVARAVRELAPYARLVLVTPRDDPRQAAAAVAAGFDAALAEPLTAEKLRTIAGEDHPAGPPRMLDPGARIDPGSELADEVGDVDMIDALLRGAPVESLTLRVVRQRSGIGGVRRVADESEVPAGHAATRVALRGRDFGLLCAPLPATDDLLAPWAGWIAHWLALSEQMSLLKDLSMRDHLTGVWNRRYFERFLKRILEWAMRERSQVTLLCFDIDDFKVYNDKYGHAAGDEILRETSKLMLSVVREHDVVARIGGDEFAVIFWDAEPPRKQGSRHPEDVLKAATRFREAIVEHRFPKLLDEAPGRLTISGGLASFPWDGRTPDELLSKADEMALRSKRGGKNALSFGPGAERAWQRMRKD